jgi:RNA polymerase sigma factor (sigma-70 family)
MRDETIEKHYRKNYKLFVNRMLRRVPGNSRALAEEVVQEAYSNALRYWKAFDPERASFDVWFNRIVNRAASKCTRAENGQPSLSYDDELEPFVLNNETRIPKVIIAKIQQAIKETKPEVSEILNMFFNLGMKTTDICECTNHSHSNIRQIIRRFRIKWNDENIF